MVNCSDKLEETFLYVTKIIKRQKKSLKTGVLSNFLLCNEICGQKGKVIKSNSDQSEESLYSDSDEDMGNASDKLGKRPTNVW